MRPSRSEPANRPASRHVTSPPAHPPEGPPIDGRGIAPIAGLTNEEVTSRLSLAADESLHRRILTSHLNNNERESFGGR